MKKARSRATAADPFRHCPFDFSTAISFGSIERRKPYNLFGSRRHTVCKAPTFRPTNLPMRKIHWALIGALATATLAQAADKMLVNVNQEGVALKGYDPVAFFTVGAPVKGKPEITVEWHGAKYQFASQRDKAEFVANSSKYEPQFGGYCAYGVGRNALVDVEIDAWQIVDGRLLLQKNKDIRDSFNENPKGNLKRADERWPKLLEKKGK